MKVHTLGLLCFFLLALLSFQSGPLSGASSPVAHAATLPKKPVNPDPSLIDRKANPCNDFFQYACGKWLAKTKIPPDHPYWFRSFSVIRKRNRLVLRHVLESYSKGDFDPSNPYARKLGEFYTSCMDTSKLEKGSMKTLRQELKRIDALKDKKDLPNLISQIQLRGSDVYFVFDSTQDFKNPDKVIAEVMQGGLALPTRDYYLKQSPQMKKIRKEYVSYMTRLLKLSGEPQGKATANAQAVLRIETDLAKSSLSPEQLRNPSRLYHPMSLAALQKLAPQFDWGRYLKAVGVPHPSSINVAIPSFTRATAKELSQASLGDLKTYLKFHLINASAQGLPDRFYQAYFNFYGKAFLGLKAIPARWKRCTDATAGMMGFALGRSFVDLTFGGNSKKIARSMIEKIEHSERSLIRSLTWMDQKTKQGAYKKLDALVNNIGYPDQWRSYKGLDIGKDSYLANRWAGAQFNIRYELNKIGKPLDRTDWLMAPSEVNAYYDPQMNKMVFPAGILQAPFFDQKYPGYANFGGIGMVMSHELSHGFDDEGRKFNAKGAMVDWWTSTSAQGFQKRAACLAKQYDQFPTAGGGHVNGKLTLGEDIGDHGGITLSYRTWLSTLPKDLRKDPKKLRPEQRKFFLSFAQAWCGKETSAFEQLTVNSDPHPPNRYRVDGVLANLPAFADAYSCKEGSKMAPKNRCVVW